MLTLLTMMMIINDIIIMVITSIEYQRHDHDHHLANAADNPVLQHSKMPLAPVIALRAV